VSKRPPDTRTGIAVVPTVEDTAAISQLVEANLRLVVSFAHRFQNCGLPMVGLIHAGNLGLVEAARRFGAGHDGTFVGFASWWVRQAMIHAIADRTGQHPMSSTVLATPRDNRVVPALLDEADECFDSLDSNMADALDDEADLDETFHDIQLRASGTPRGADRLRSHLN
jgi:RNA polymerase sigma factor (sigma-70 family)